MMSRITLLAASAGMIALSACTDTMGTTGTTGGLSRTQQGAIAGAAAGAVLGAVRDDDSNNQGRDAARGAIVGGLAGAAVGATLDAQQRALQSQLATPGVTVVNTGSTLNVVLPEGVLFATDSAAVSGPAQSDLLAVAQNLRQYPNSTVQVIGHTDSVGSDAANDLLSRQRAEVVRTAFAARGLAADKVVTVGRGKRELAVPTGDGVAEPRNRRVEILVR